MALIRGLVPPPGRSPDLRLSWIFAALFLSLALVAPAGAQGRAAKPRPGYGQWPLAFEPNEGQSDPGVAFLCRGAGYGIFVTGSDTVLALTRTEPKEKSSMAKGPKGVPAPRISNDVLRFKLLGANERPRVAGIEPLAGRSNYFIGNDPSQWRTNVPQYARVKSAQVYPGIDLVYYGRQRQLEYDFQVAPGADPGAIRFTIEGARAVTLDAHGDLVLKTPGGSVIEEAPLIYQEVDGRRETIGGGYELSDGAKADSHTGDSVAVRFRVAAYDRTRTLVIDPVLTYSTYLGGSSFDQCAGIAIGPHHAAYVTGMTFSSDFPVTNGAYQTNLTSSFSQAFVTKLNANGTALVYSTYIGGNAGDEASAIAVDSGNAYITGETSSSNFPTTAGAYQTSLPAGPSGGGEAISPFVTKLNASGSGLVYSTFLGGTGQDAGNGIAVDGSGNAYVTGYTISSSFPTTTGAFQTSLAGNQDAFVTKLNTAGSGLVYSAYLGGNSYSEGQGIAVDGSGDAYVTGYTGSTNFPTTTGAFQTVGGESGETGFVTAVNPTGTALLYSSYLGGSGSDDGYAIAVDASGSAYVTGQTTSSDFPTTTGAFQASLGGADGCAFVTKINPGGATLGYSSYLGGGGAVGDQGSGIAVDAFGDAYVTGATYSSTFPTTANALQRALGGTTAELTNAFVTEVNPTGTSLIYSTYFGGSGTGNKDDNGDAGSGIALDASGDIYVAGSTNSSNFPTTPGAFQTALGGSGAQNVFVAEFSSSTSYSVGVSAGPNGAVSPNGTVTVTSGSGVTFTATPAAGYQVGQWLVNGSVAQTGGTNYTFANVTANAAVQVTFVADAFFFAASSEQVQNKAGTVTVTVSRNFAGAGFVNFQTFDDTGTNGIEYTGTQGSLVFSGTQTQATITVPILADASAPATTDFLIELSNPGNGVTLGTPASADIFILNDLAGDLSISQPTFTLPQTAPAATASITVDLSPGAADGQWKLFGELNWRDSGDTATGLPAGNYEVEFETEPGYLQPPVQVVPVTSGSQAVVSASYTLSGSAGTGSLQVTLEPQGMGGWRIQGSSAWLASGTTLTGLNANDYILEFEPVSGFETPENAEAVVYSGSVATVSVTYLVGDSTIGLPPAIVSGSAGQTQAPYVFTGEIQTDEGFGSGFAPMDRVVLTAAHVLFDDATLSYIPGVRWFFQYQSGTYEPPAQIPAGSYVLSGYASQRTVDIDSGVSPGVATTASRELDAAALYFLEPAARGGASGYLGSDSASNPWLAGAQNKFIAGYPIVNGTTGFLYATPTVQSAFQYVAGTLFSTTAITSYSGNSGGPVFVQYSDGNYYPAAIYLGGSDETIVHAIDSQVVALMTEAEVAGNGGINNSGGGIVQVSEGVTGVTAFTLGGVTVTLSPADAVAAGAYWEIGDGVKRYSGQTALGLAPGQYTVDFFSGGPGYSAPAAAPVTVMAGVGTPVTGSYTPNAPTITSGTQATVIEGQAFSYQITVTPDATGYAVASGALPAGLALDGATGLISGTIPLGATPGHYSVSLQATNNEGPGSDAPLVLNVAQPGTLNVSISGKGTLSKIAPNPQIVGNTITIKATPARGYVFESWSDADTGEVLSTQESYSFQMQALLDLQANFIANPFLPEAGSYLALVNGDSYADSGFAKLTVAANGSFTSTLTLGGSTSRVVRAAFTDQGQYQGEFEAPGAGLFNAALSLNGALLTGTLTSQGDGSQVTLATERPAARSDAALAGTYTVLLPAPVGGSDSLPGGNGYGTLTISKTGAVKFTGKLGDGLPVALTGMLDSHGVWSFLYTRAAGRANGSELMLGSVAFPPAASGTAGTLSWYRNADLADFAYTGGFATSVPFVTCRYSAPAVSATGVEVTFSGADEVFAPVQENASVTVKGKVATAKNVIVPNTGANRFFLSFVPATGLFSGTFVDNSVTRAFTGAVLTSGSYGLGQFQDALGQTGSVLLQTTP